MCSNDGHAPATAPPPHSRQNSATSAAGGVCGGYSAAFVAMPGVHETNCDFKLIVEDVKSGDQVSKQQGYQIYNKG